MEDEKDIKVNNIAPIISASHLKIIQDEFMKIIKSIKVAYDIKDSTFLEKYTKEINGLNVKLGMKKRNRRVLEDDKRCMGRKIDGKQCTRSRLSHTEFCKSHKENLPHGRIDDTSFELPEKGKRGRKKKKVDYNNGDYIATTVQMIGTQQYLVDENNLVYSYNIESPVFIGKKVDDKIVKIETENDILQFNTTQSQLVSK